MGFVSWYPDLYPQHGFPVEGVQESHPLAVSIRGSFDSYFSDRASPFEDSSTTVPLTSTVEAPLGTIPVSPESSVPPGFPGVTRPGRSQRFELRPS